MTIMNAALSVGAITSGILFLDNGSAANSNFSITSCTNEKVVIAGMGAGTLLSPGQIFAYIGNHDDVHNPSSDSDIICNSCSPLFRKIVARSIGNGTAEESNSSDNGNTNTYTTFTTTFATFSEVFPDDIFADTSLANAHIEEQFDCGYSSFDERRHRNLRKGGDKDEKKDDPPKNKNEETEGGICSNIPLILILMGACSCTCPIYAPCFALIGYIFEVFDFFECSDGRRRRLVYGQEQEEEKQFMEPSFPNSCEDWMDVDSEGKCLYADCTIAAINHEENNNSSHSCFFQQNSTNMSFDISNISALLVDKNDFGEASCIQNNCYASKFSKETCDNNIYKLMTAKCDSLFSESIPIVETSLPLTALALEQNCYIASVVFYLAVKLFGHASYNHLQSMQSEYQETVCQTDSMVGISPS